MELRYLRGSTFWHRNDRLSSHVVGLSAITWRWHSNVVRSTFRLDLDCDLLGLRNSDARWDAFGTHDSNGNDTILRRAIAPGVTRPVLHNTVARLQQNFRSIIEFQTGFTGEDYIRSTSLPNSARPPLSEHRVPGRRLTSYQRYWTRNRCHPCPRLGRQRFPP